VGIPYVKSCEQAGTDEQQYTGIPIFHNHKVLVISEKWKNAVVRKSRTAAIALFS
jgi:hypothetical protein